MRAHSITDEDRLNHIREALNFILSHTGNLSEDDFYNNEVLKKAVVRDLEVIGGNMYYLQVNKSHLSGGAME